MDDHNMDDIASGLHGAFLDAYEPYLDGRLVALGVDRSESLDAAIGEGRAWLDGALADLLERPFGRQDRSPLELFQESMRFATEALAHAGADPVERDEAVAHALPGDHYGLAPASSQDLGEAAWRAHIAWGARKAQSMTRPRVALLSADLMDTSRVESSVERAGYALVVWRRFESIGDDPPSVTFVDLAHPDADEAIQAVASANRRVVAYGPHVDDFAMTRAKTLGATEAVPRSRFFREISGFLPQVV